ncbi:MurR/RpiR family transcriptional regulator [Microbacterium jejuense]|uniref:MurR/RpiR family transcriptional regulator n=1 Tax=Microbacterium jejuense TaxID=1263637 RepID=A0ABS7HIB1_9MICO|nr:MurR/RpiR family transcriptional regulator [Microbacterium jejuense]MBW9092170.1 MurR/RpiR family transcriptional regulator [Microbacterium jejuense]
MYSHVAEPPVGGTIDHILSVLPSLVPSAQRVARICAERPQEVVDMSGADLAEAAGTSAATVSRTSQALGFRGFQHMRMLLIRDLGAAAQDEEARPQGTEGWLHTLADGAAGLIRSSLASVDAEIFDAAADAIAGARRVLVVGTGGSHPAAQAVAVNFIMNGRSCEAPIDGVVQQLTASVLGEGDVCLVVSSSGANSVTLASAAAAADAGATVIGVTGFARAPIAEYADLLLVGGARFQSWDRGTLGSGLVQLLLLTALQIAVAERMTDVAEHAQAAVRDEVLGIVAEETADGPVESGDDPDAASDVRGETV